MANSHVAVPEGLLIDLSPAIAPSNLPSIEGPLRATYASPVKGSVLGIDNSRCRIILWGMARKLCIEYPGGIYHVMNRERVLIVATRSSSALAQRVVFNIKN